jgi:CHASE3 domain sensor protein
MKDDRMIALNGSSFIVPFNRWRKARLLPHLPIARFFSLNSYHRESCWTDDLTAAAVSPLTLTTTNVHLDETLPDRARSLARRMAGKNFCSTDINHIQGGRTMLHFKDMKIRNKLIATFTLILLFMTGIGWVAYQGMTQIQHNLNDIFSISLPSIDKLIEADRDMQQMLVAERSLISADPKAPIFATLRKEYEKNLTQVNERFNIFKGLVNSPEEKELIAKFERDRAAWEPVSRQVVENSASGETEARRQALELSLGKANELFETTRGNLDKLTEISLKNAENAQQEATGGGTTAAGRSSGRIPGVFMYGCSKGAIRFGFTSASTPYLAQTR